MAFLIHRDGDLQFQILSQLGIVENGKEKKMTSTHTSISQKEKQEINHHTTAHSLSLQRSKYICIDSDISKEHILLKNSKQFVKTTGDKALCNYDFDKLRSLSGDKSIFESTKSKMQMSLRYCPIEEVNVKRQRFLTTQAQFFIKINHLKSMG